MNPQTTSIEAFGDTTMKTFARAIATLGLALSLSVGGAAVARAADPERKPAAEPATKPAGEAAAEQAAPTGQSFESPEAAVAALVAAARAGDVKALIAILGPDSKPLVDSGDLEADDATFANFVANYDAGHKITQKGDDVAILATGEDFYPFAIPIVKNEAGWYFDTDAGQEELVDRRIGRNELSTIQAVLAFVDAQREYYQRNPAKAALQQYAHRLISSPGKRDGLYWPTQADEPDSPIGKNFVEAHAESYKKGGKGKLTPFHGYVFRILDGQGPHAPGGAYSYLVKDQMIGGFGLIARPATWDVTGVMTFIVNQEGVVYQKDLGPDTEAVAAAIQVFDPDESWKPVAEDDETPIPAAEADSEQDAE